LRLSKCFEPEPKKAAKNLNLIYTAVGAGTKKGFQPGLTGYSKAKIKKKANSA
jgi:hypothetical protein